MGILTVICVHADLEKFVKAAFMHIFNKKNQKVFFHSASRPWSNLFHAKYDLNMYLVYVCFDVDIACKIKEI